MGDKNIFQQSTEDDFLKTNNPTYSRISVTYIFFICGTLSGNWVVRIPDLQRNYFLSKGDLGLVLTGGSVGAILMMVFIGNLINKFGSKTMTILGTVLYHIFLPLIFLMPSPFFLWSFLALIGISGTIMDISMNSQGIEVEKALKTSTMSLFHAFFSIGNVCGAIMGGLFIKIGIVPEIHFLFISLLFLPISIISFKFLRKEKISEKNGSKKFMAIQFPPREIWIIGLIVFIAGIGELMIGDWGSIYIINYTGVDASIAAFGYAIFSICMTTGRLFGDSLANRYANDKIIRVFAILASIGLIIAIWTSELIVIFIGFALFGIGLSILIPIVYKVAGHNSVTEIGSGIAGVALFSYTAGIVEPILIGQIGESFSIKIAFFIIAILITLIFVMANKIKHNNFVSSS